ncbi:hypothetical protein HWN39_06455 [Lactobacillus rhamnosus]|uniref:Uncharacterized protein n=1 Tax=Lacticaseibacillus rhamnosus TaxID=47715 RepID=A0A7Y7QFK2_LACRH|nr:hypothetical protein [Lacticaseibacillus rhamnosus]NVO88141.1 hypothetical protein [Lacticaseibacillus rhamnosus]
MLSLILDVLLIICGIVLLVSCYRFSEEEIREALNDWALNTFVFAPVLGWIGKKMNVRSPYRKAMFLLGLAMTVIFTLNLIAGL